MKKNRKNIRSEAKRREQEGEERVRMEEVEVMEIPRMATEELIARINRMKNKAAGVDG